MPNEIARVENAASEVTASRSTAAKRPLHRNVHLDELGNEHNTMIMSPAIFDGESLVNSKENMHLPNGPPAYDSKWPHNTNANVKDDKPSKVNCRDVMKASGNVRNLANLREQTQQLVARRKGKAGKPTRIAKLSISKKKLTSVPQSIQSICPHPEASVPHTPGAEGRDFVNEDNPSSIFVPLPCDKAKSIRDECEENGDWLPHSQCNNAARNYAGQPPHGITRQKVYTSSRTKNWEALTAIHGKRMPMPSGILRSPRGKLIVKGNARFRGLHNAPVLQTNVYCNSMEHSDGHILERQTGVREWLHNLGLGKYIQLFEAHEVGPEVLPLLTFDDLREIGVLAVGSRRKMYSAIQQFTMNVGQRPVSYI